MPITHENLVAIIKQNFPDAEINARDLAGDNDHWQVEIKSSAFAGKSRIEQHRMVQNAVANENIHALSIKTII
jgi:stress-induced morphogen